MKEETVSKDKGWASNTITCPYCKTTITGSTQTELGYNYSAHLSICSDNPANKDED